MVTCQNQLKIVPIVVRQSPLSTITRGVVTIARNAQRCFLAKLAHWSLEHWDTLSRRAERCSRSAERKSAERKAAAKPSTGTSSALVAGPSTPVDLQTPTPVSAAPPAASPQTPVIASTSSQPVSNNSETNVNGILDLINARFLEINYFTTLTTHR